MPVVKRRRQAHAVDAIASGLAPYAGAGDLARTRDRDARAARPRRWTPLEAHKTTSREFVWTNVLSPHQLRVLLALAEGASTREAAARFGSTPERITWVMREVKRKLRASSNMHAVHLAHVAGLFAPDSGVHPAGTLPSEHDRASRPDQPQRPRPAPPPGVRVLG